MKAIDLVLRELIPDDISLEGVTLDKKGVGSLLEELAAKHPNRYKHIVQEMANMGRDSAYLEGETITLADLRPTFDKDSVIQRMKDELVLMESTTPKAHRKQKRLEIYAKYSDKLDKMTLKSITGNTRHNLGNNVISGSRGKPSQLKAMITTPAVYTDYKDEPIDMFVEKSFSQGLRPAEHLASSFGTRKGVIATKEATADAGDLAKQMVQAATKQVVTEADCGTTNGILMPIDTPEELRGRVLQRSYGEAKAGGVIDKGSFGRLKDAKADEVMVRSPMTCTSKEGVCQLCSGLDMDNRLPPIGSTVGITAGQALGEPLTQGALNTKHGGGALGAPRVQTSGFKVLNQIMQAPSTYPNKAALSEVNGTVNSIKEAPQGGTLVTVEDEEHYVPAGFEINVKKGDVVEMGDRLSEGLLNMRDIVRLRGLGEARKTYVDYLHEIFDNSGIYANKRNLEFVARGALDHMRVTGNNPVGNFLPDDIASYNTLVGSFVPPATAKHTPLNNAVGKYLQEPALHYSIGTKLTPKMVSQLQKAKFSKLLVDDEPGDFEPDMIRLRTAVQHEKDWMASLHSSYQADRLSTAAQTGAVTNTESNTHFAPRLAKGTGFGDKAKTTGKF